MHARQAKYKRKIYINVLNTQYEIIKTVAQSMHYCLSYNEQDDSDVVWHDLGIEPDQLASLTLTQKINHFPGMSAIAKKNFLAKNLYKMKKLFPAQYDFFPKTWLLPSDWSQLKETLLKGKRNYYIVKPESLSQGQGIFLTKTFENVDSSQHLVAQKYITDPYLINGLKFDLRIYVLVYGCDPLRIYVYNEGLARFCTEKYAIPSPSNCNNYYMHLTNYAINKNSNYYVFNKDKNHTDVGHKRSLTSIWKHIDSNGGSSQLIKDKINNQIVKTLIAIQPSLAHLYHACQPSDTKNDMCFELLGFDAILDSNLEPYILEVNQAPSFNIDSPFDESVKSSMLSEIFKILNISVINKANFYKQLRICSEDKLNNWKPLKQSLEQKRIDTLHKMEERDNYEKTVTKDFILIYPNQVKC